MSQYDHSKVDKKWHSEWEKQSLYQSRMGIANDKYYNLMMFPYPSAEGLHVGNMYAFTGSDIWGRYNRLKGYRVFEPIGLDGFGIHSENYAIKIKEHIRDVSKRTEKHFYEQLHMIGNQYDWKRTVETYDPGYYKWTQWLFIQMYKNGLAYRKAARVNWCPSCKTVLSDEQVIDGECERCGSEVTKKKMEQWFWKITQYADQLLKNLDWIDWTEEVKTGQRNWIGRKEGINITYKVKGSKETITVFTTRPDTNFGATFIVIAPEHQDIDKLTTPDTKGKVEEYIKQASKKSEIERTELQKDKTGVFTGSYAINQLTGKKMPIYVADYVLTNFGTGAVVGVPGHDMRDFEFAKKYDIEIVRVVVGSDGDTSQITKAEQVNEEEGTMINSGFLDGVEIHDAIGKMINHIEKEGWGERTVSYKLRDWCVSRQRYWGPPIPMIHCEKCGWNPVKEEDLPVLLPEIEKFEDILPDGSGKGPLAKQESFVNTTCPECGSKATRETDVSDPFVDSCWYFLRYPSTEFDTVPFDSKRTKNWLPVDMYIGGKEHTVLHLLYARFITMALKDFGFIDFEEPFKTFFGHGLLIKEGAKMSKSKGNVINPDEYIAKYGADAVRMYLMFLGDFRQGGDWRDSGMEGMSRFIRKIYNVCTTLIQKAEKKEIEVRNGTSTSIHVAIKGITQDLENIKFHTAIAKLMIFFNGQDNIPDWRGKVDAEGNIESVSDIKTAVDIDAMKKFLILLAPFAPHLSEELWAQSGGDFSIHEQKWPDFDKSKAINEMVTIAIQVNGKLRDTIEVERGASESDVVKEAKGRDKVKKYIDKKAIKKTVFVKDRLVSFVVGK